MQSHRNLFIFAFAFVCIASGLSSMWHLSLILTNMMIGMFIANTQPENFSRKISAELSSIMPLLFILFFVLAGSSLHIESLPRLGAIGIVYILARSAGLIGGSRIGAVLGKANVQIRKYIGLGILSQAGVAIGLSLIVKNEFAGIGPVIESKSGEITTAGDSIGVIIITTITATCIFFELIGPILTKYALTKSGEIPPH
jgi:Kef-type K+ transport system membrane component KefB